MSAIVAELYDALRKAGVDEELAKSAARAVLGAEARADLATKADLAELKSELRVDMAQLRVDMAQLRVDMAELRATTRADLAELKADVIKWNVGAIAVMTGIFAAIVRLA